MEQNNRFFKFFITGSVLFSLISLWLVFYKYPVMPLKIPLLYSLQWGNAQLAPKIFLFTPFLIQIIAFLIAIKVKNTLHDTFYAKLMIGAAAAGNVVANLAILRIVSLVGFVKPWPAFLSTDVVFPFITAFVISIILIPPTITTAKALKMVDDPKLRKHPAMLQKHAIPRAGGLPIFIAFCASLLLFVPLSKHIVGILLGGLVTVVTGLWDDKFDLNPYKRFALNFAAALTVVAAGVGIAYFNIPFIDKFVDLGSINFRIGSHNITLLADIFVLIWIVWIMNMLNWSKGVDGQFPGIVIVSALVIGILALKIAPVDPTQLVLAKIAFCAAGATLGFLLFNWHPSKILPGYSTTFLGLTLATLSVYSGSKITIAIIVLLVPTLDALASILRRLVRGQSPFWHDREHLHHRLLNRGWSHQQIAYFYWGITALSGTVALFTAGKQKWLAFLTLGGIAAFAIAAMNLQALFSHRRHKQPSNMGERKN